MADETTNTPDASADRPVSMAADSVDMSAPVGATMVAEMVETPDMAEFRAANRKLFVHLKDASGSFTPAKTKEVAMDARRSFTFDGPCHQIVRMYTDYALGNGIAEVKASDDTKQGALEDFWEAPANRRQLGSFGQRRNSDRLLVDGNHYFALFVTDNGVKVRVIDFLEIAESITHPEDSDDVLFYVRKTVKKDKPSEKKTRLYWSLEAFDDKDAVALVKDDDKKDGVDVSLVDDKVVVTHGPEVEIVENAAVYHSMFNAVGFGDTGLSVLAGSIDWAFLHNRFMQARSVIQQSKAQILTRAKIRGGPSAVDTYVNARTSTVTSTDNTETNPPPAFGSEQVHNQAVEYSDVKQETGGGDATKDGGMLLQMVGLYAGIFPIYLGAGESFRLATATAMVGPMIRIFSAYQKGLTDSYAIISEFALAHAKDGDIKGDNKVLVIAKPVEEEEASARLLAIAKAAQALGIQGDEQVRRIATTLMGVENPEDVEGEETPDDGQGMSVRESTLAVRKSIQALTSAINFRNDPGQAQTQAA